MSLFANRVFADLDNSVKIRIQGKKRLFSLNSSKFSLKSLPLFPSSFLLVAIVLGKAECRGTPRHNGLRALDEEKYSR